MHVLAHVFLYVCNKCLCCCWSWCCYLLLVLQEMLACSQALEDALVKLCHEKGQLEAEYARMPAHAGRTGKARARRLEVERRLQDIAHEIGQLRLSLKKLHGK